ncbi:MAG: GntR family transcriptional regulator [Bacilli bacterium]|nr:GntR family transcriptional regulator [Bacilli bacterium]
MIIANNQPIFESIASYFRKMISLGVFHEGDALPSVRDVAMNENVNPNTVVRAYNLLIDENLVQSIPKKGYFVKSSNASLDNRPLRKALSDLLDLGYTKEEIIETLSALKGGAND